MELKEISTLTIGIYISGFIVCYLLLRYAYKKQTYIDWTWGTVILCLFGSLFSWVGVLSTLITASIGWLLEIKSKPPKWF